MLPKDVELRLARLEAQIETLEKVIATPPKQGLMTRLFSWETARNLMFLVGIPAGLFAAYQQLDQQFLSWSDIQTQQERNIAVDKLGKLQNFQADIYELQAREQSDAAFARLDATRGQIERMARDLYTHWQKDPEFFSPTELVPVVNALIGSDLSEQAVDVANSVDITGMQTIKAADFESLKARVLFARGPGRDVVGAREALSRAATLVESLPDGGQKLSLREKYASVRLLNELWVGTNCTELAPLQAFLSEMIADGTPIELEDPIRKNTKASLTAFDLKCR
ncbi:MAG: hypothetical protein AB8B71_09680 [Paracoccaceae bacterium]